MRRLLAIILVILLTLGGYLPASARVASMSIVKEKELGKEAYKQITSQLPVIDDPDSVEYIRDLGARLANQMEDRRFDYNFNLIASPEVNAFAIPGGYIFVFAGLLTEFDNEGQLASVVAHEIGHVRQRHIASRIDRSKPTNIASLAGIIAGVLLGALAGAPQLGQALTLGTVAGGIQQQLAFSREDEEQADYVGYKLITGLGYDPQEMIEGFKKVYRLETMMAPQVATYLRTHPQSPARMDAIANLMRRNPTRVTPHSNADFLRIKTRLTALYDPIRQAEDDFIRQSSQNPSDPMPHYGMALVMMRQHNYPKALQELESMGPETTSNPYFQREIATCYARLGRLDRAEPLFQQVLTQRPKDRAALKELGQVYMGRNNLSAAESVYRRLVDLDDRDDDAQYQLGVTLGRGGRTGVASYYLGSAFVLRHNKRMARYHLEKATKSGELSRKQMDNAAEMLKELDKPEKKPEPE